MITKKYAMAYREVIEILKYVPDEDVEKIPKYKLEFYRKNMDATYNYKIDETKEFEEQEMSDITKSIFANIFRDYWATPYQKKKIEAKEKSDLLRIDEEKREKYNPNDIFINKKSEAKEEQACSLPVVVKRENFIERLINFIKNFIKK